jgi:hypothetical protein
LFDVTVSLSNALLGLIVELNVSLCACILLADAAVFTYKAYMRRPKALDAAVMPGCRRQINVLRMSART